MTALSHRPSLLGGRVRGRRRRNRGPGRTVLVGAITLAVVLGLIYLAITFISGVPTVPYETMYVNAQDVGALAQHDNVSIGGVRVGQVSAVNVTNDGTARVTLQLNPGTKIMAGSTVKLRANGLLGARYVEIVEGHGSKLPARSTLTAGANALTYGVPDLLDTFNTETRGQLKNAVTALGEGFVGNGQSLNTGIYRSSRATQPFQQIFAPLAAEPDAVRALLPDMDSGFSALAQNRQGIVNLFSPAVTALQPLVDHRSQLDETLQDAPSALTTATSGLSSGTKLLTAVDKLAVSARSTLVDAPAGLKGTSALLTAAQAPVPGGTTPLQGLNSLLQDVNPAVHGTLDITGGQLNQVLSRLNSTMSTATPIVNLTGQYGCDLENLGETLRSMTGYVGTGSGDEGALGQFRLQAVAGIEALGVSDVQAKRNAYPAPCQYATLKSVPPLPGYSK